MLCYFWAIMHKSPWVTCASYCINYWCDVNEEASERGDRELETLICGREVDVREVDIALIGHYTFCV